MRQPHCQLTRLAGINGQIGSAARLLRRQAVGLGRQPLGQQFDVDAPDRGQGVDDRHDRENRPILAPRHRLVAAEQADYLCRAAGVAHSGATPKAE